MRLALLGADLAGRVLESVEEAGRLAATDAAAIERLRGAFAEAVLASVPELDGEVEDLEGLARVAAHLGAG